MTVTHLWRVTNISSSLCKLHRSQPCCGEHLEHTEHTLEMESGICYRSGFTSFCRQFESFFPCEKISPLEFIVTHEFILTTAAVLCDKTNNFQQSPFMLRIVNVYFFKKTDLQKTLCYQILWLDTFRASMTRSRASSSPSRMLKSISNSGLVILSMFSLDCEDKRWEKEHGWLIYSTSGCTWFYLKLMQVDVCENVCDASGHHFFIPFY